jgi:hypothetical protein
MSLRGKLLKKLIKRGTRSSAQRRALAKAVKASALARKASAKGVVSKIRVKRLTKLSKRIAKNKKVIKSLRTGNSTVYRLQNKNGIGFMNKRVLPPKSIARLKGKPFPVTSKENIKALRKAMPDFEFERLNFDRSMKFGFKDMRQAKKYFSEAERAWYKTKGYEIAKVSDVFIADVNKSQLVFKQAKGIGKANKEAAKLTAKYVKLMKKVK